MLKLSTVIMDDFSESLMTLGDTLKHSPKNTDPIATDLVRDARIHSFLAAQRVFEEALVSLFESAEIDEDEDCECDDIEHGLTMLYAVGLLSEDQFRKLTTQREVAEFLSIDRLWLEAEEDIDLFDQCVENINNYYYLLCSCWRDLAVLTDEQETEEVIDGH
jgi:hypothetical protein